MKGRRCLFHEYFKGLRFACEGGHLTWDLEHWQSVDHLHSSCSFISRVDLFRVEHHATLQQKAKSSGDLWQTSRVSLGREKHVYVATSKAFTGSLWSKNTCEKDSWFRYAVTKPLRELIRSRKLTHVPPRRVSIIAVTLAMSQPELDLGRRVLYLS